MLFNSFEFISGLPWHGLYTLRPLHRREIYGYWGKWLRSEAFVPQQSFGRDSSQLNEHQCLERIFKSSFRDSAIRRTLRILAPVDGFSKTASAALYRDAILFLTRRSGNVCLISMPVFGPLRRIMAETPSFVRARTFFKTLTAENGAHYVDLLAKPYPDQFFSDPHHLNAEGARAVSREVQEARFSLMSATDRFRKAGALN